MAKVGALLVNELLHNTRAQLEHPMTIQFLSGEGPKLDLVDLRALREPSSPKPQG